MQADPKFSKIARATRDEEGKRERENKNVTKNKKKKKKNEKNFAIKWRLNPIYIVGKFDVWLIVVHTVCHPNLIRTEIEFYQICATRLSTKCN